MRKRSMILAMLLCIVMVSSAVPVQATATTEVEVIKYAANNYSTVVNSTTLNYSQMEDLFTVQGNGVTHYFHQGPIFTDEWNSTNCPIYENWTTGQWCHSNHSGMGAYDVWDRNETMNFKTKGSPKGTDIKDLCEQVGGMSPGDEIQVLANDNFKKWFNYTNVYNNRANTTLNNKQGPMILTWYAYGNYTGTSDYYSGMRLVFFANTTTHVNTTEEGEKDLYVFGDWDMHECLAPWYWHNYSTTYPSTTGLSVKYVDHLKIYPPHLHDFNTTGDTTGWAFRGEVSANPPNTPDDPSTEFNSAAYANIADDDGTFQSDFSDSNYAAHRFNFSIDNSTAKDGPIADIETLNITWNGKGWHDNGGAANGTYLYIWNSSGYEELDSTTSGAEVYLTGEITSGISNYINSGNVTVLVVQKTVGDEIDYSHIETDYVNMTVTHHHHN